MKIAELPADRVALIDKVVRLRCQQGRFGIDHSEILNFQIHSMNKPHLDRMNWLAYKAKAGDELKLSKFLEKYVSIDTEVDKPTSRPQTACVGRLTHAEWLKQKDAQKRLRRKLLNQVKREFKTELDEAHEAKRHRRMASY